jgi:Ca-activated chloride channel family protein
VRLGTFALAVTLVANLSALRAAPDAAAMARLEPVAPQDQAQARPTFRGGVSMVSVSAVVRKHNGQWVTGLTEDEFQVLDNGTPRPITNFEATNRGVNVALLVDFSGSMDVAGKLTPVRDTVEQMVAWLAPANDTVGLFAFDTRLHELQPMSPAPSAVVAKLGDLKPFGATSIYDAIAETSRKLTTQGPRRAIVAITDGGDNASRLTPEEVSGIASAIDVPVYVVVVVSPLDKAGSSVVDPQALDATMHGRLADLAHWTGGEIFAAIGPAQANTTARQIVTELRQEYWLAFEPGVQPGWHTLEVRTRHKDFVVRARSGYMVQASGLTR